MRPPLLAQKSTCRVDSPKFIRAQNKRVSKIPCEYIIHLSKAICLSPSIHEEHTTQQIRCTSYTTTMFQVCLLTEKLASNLHLLDLDRKRALMDVSIQHTQESETRQRPLDFSISLDPLQEESSSHL